jgi:hydroxymethylglutaryl-CoA lyase
MRAFVFRRGAVQIMNLPASVKLREVAPRDGFQSIPEFIPTAKKLEIIGSIIAAGVKYVETTSFVSSKAIPQLRDASELMARVPRSGIVHAALVPNLKGARNAIAAKVDELVVVISASEAHNQANVRRSIRDSLSDLDSIFDLAEDRNVAVNGAIAVSFGCPYEGDVPEEDVFSLVDAYVDRGASAVILADTTGMATPARVERMVKAFLDRYAAIECILHFHNNRGAAMANLLTALMAGASAFDCALGGIGGCPNVPHAAGNLATEDVVFMLEDMGVSTGINLESIIVAAHQLEKVVGFTLPGQVMKSGPRDPGRSASICR